MLPLFPVLPGGTQAGRGGVISVLFLSITQMHVQYKHYLQEQIDKKDCVEGWGLCFSSVV